MSLMLTEWNLEDAIKYNREEGREEGRKEGLVYAYYEMNLQTNEIARKVHITEAEVLDIIKRKDMQI